ncbi:winged helix-turn-helix domain-containing protein [Streptomyces sp. NBC_00820]|uniref:AfsR/SARP family transcriptional regulator n=1 Tax=Streptomyces sp. NBC_00820 TaxID=2975842 RepID=UPI002ED42268|nr:winged helix-turn-helix domain-containing protein [Streptomyces sp. NBC_00820]
MPDLIELDSGTRCPDIADARGTRDQEDKPQPDAVRFSLLGPVRAWRGGTEIALGSPQQQTVLAVLLLNNGAQVPTEHLVRAVWGEHPPASGTSVVRTYITRLRHILGPKKSLIRTRSGGYALSTAPESLDVERFRHLTVRARAARSQGAIEDAATLLREALRIWSGTPLAGQKTPFAQVQRNVLNEWKILAAEECLAIDVERGRHAQASVELFDLLETHPLRERLSELLMLALYRSGRQTEALDVYRRAHTVLRRELGVEPGPGLRTMHQRILGADPQLVGSDGQHKEGPARGTPARPADARKDAVVPPPAPLPTLPAQLPRDPVAFVGREWELTHLNSLVSEADGPAGAVTVTAINGAAGTGKTALAVHWAHRVAHLFPDGQLYVDLKGFSSAPAISPTTTQQAFLHALGIHPARPPESPDEWTGLYRSALVRRRVLIILDNARDAEQVRALLPAAPDCRTVITSRPPLPTLVAAEGAAPLTLYSLDTASAMEIMIRRLGSERASAEPEALEEIVDLCGRLPLALAIVAARAQIHPRFPLKAIATELRAAHGSLDAFTGEGDTDLRTALSWSYQQLSAPAARMFRLLSAHQGPDISVAVAARLIGDSPRQAHALIVELSRTQMIRERTPGRYVLHDLLRAYSFELFNELGSAVDC